MPAELCHIKAEDLAAFSAALLAAAGVPPGDADVMAEGLVLANLRGVDSHGVSRLPAYLAAFASGSIGKVSEWRVVSETTSSLVVDAGNSIGSVVGIQIMDALMEKAASTGIVVATVRNSTHFGMAAHPAMHALRRDMIGFAVSNSAPAMAPWGGVEAFTGTNPLCCAIPAGEAPPVVLDMATSVAAKGKIIMALAETGTIPEGWALDRRGLPTTDAGEAMAGTVMPVGGAKGWGISLLIDIISSALSGGAFGPHVNNLYQAHGKPLNICHTFGVVNPGLFVPIERFRQHVDAMVREVKSGPRAPGVEEILLPGEKEFNTEQARRRRGIPLPPHVFAELMHKAAEHGLAADLPVRREGPR